MAHVQDRLDALAPRLDCFERITHGELDPRVASGPARRLDRLDRISPPYVNPGSSLLDALLFFDAMKDGWDRDFEALAEAARKERRTRIAVAAAAISFIGWIVCYATWIERTVGRPRMSAYFAGYVLAGLISSVFVALVTLIFKGRNRFRFCVAFTAASVLGLTLQVQKLSHFTKEVIRAGLPSMR